MLLDGESNQVGRALEAERLHQPRFVIFDRPDGDVQIVRDLAVDPSPVSSIGKEYGIVERTIRQTWSEPGLLVAPYLMVGGTDSKYFSASLAKNVYRFTPVRVESAADTGPGMGSTSACWSPNTPGASGSIASSF